MLCSKIASRWIIELNVGAKTEVGNSFLNMTPQEKALRERRMSKPCFIKVTKKLLCFKCHQESKNTKHRTRQNFQVIYLMRNWKAEYKMFLKIKKRKDKHSMKNEL